MIFKADALSRDWESGDFKFGRPAKCCAFMLAAGMVNRHVVDCFRYIQASAV